MGQPCKFLVFFASERGALAAQPGRSAIGHRRPLANAQQRHSLIRQLPILLFAKWALPSENTQKFHGQIFPSPIIKLSLRLWV
jgi:hypothetical protein